MEVKIGFKKLTLIQLFYQEQMDFVHFSQPATSLFWRIVKQVAEGWQYSLFTQILKSKDYFIKNIDDQII